MNIPWASAVSAFGIPVLGLSVLLVGLWHTSAFPHQRVLADVEEVSLLQPDPRLDRSLTIYLRQEARLVAHARLRADRAALKQAVSDYNLIARECTPAVFAATRLPPSVEA